MDTKEKLAELKELIQKANYIVFFGGAGVSTESGLPDFRSVDGLYHQKYAFPPEEILSHDFFMARPKEFYQFYKEKLLIPGILPNPAHYALQKLEEQGKNRLALLVGHLLNAGRMDDLKRVSYDEAYREKLLKEFGL